MLSPTGVYASHFLGQVPGCAYTICLYGQIIIFIIIIILFLSFFPHQHQLMVSHWSLSDSKPPQVFQDFSQYSGRA